MVAIKARLVLAHKVLKGERAIPKLLLKTILEQVINILLIKSLPLEQDFLLHKQI